MGGRLSSMSLSLTKSSSSSSSEEIPTVGAVVLRTSLSKSNSSSLRSRLRSGSAGPPASLAVSSGAPDEPRSVIRIAWFRQLGPSVDLEVASRRSVEF